MGKAPRKYDRYRKRQKVNKESLATRTYELASAGSGTRQRKVIGWTTEEAHAPRGVVGAMERRVLGKPNKRVLVAQLECGHGVVFRQAPKIVVTAAYCRECHLLEQAEEVARAALEPAPQVLSEPPICDVLRWHVIAVTRDGLPARVHVAKLACSHELTLRAKPADPSRMPCSVCFELGGGAPA